MEANDEGAARERERNGQWREGARENDRERRGRGGGARGIVGRLRGTRGTSSRTSEGKTEEARLICGGRQSTLALQLQSGGGESGGRGRWNARARRRNRAESWLG